MNSWFTVKVKYTKQLDDGTFKRVSEPYLLAAMTFTDAEARIYEELGSLIRGEFIVTGISRTDVHDIFHYEDSETWWKCKVRYLSESDGEEGRKAKKITQNFLVLANGEIEAAQRLRESLGGMLIDFDVPNVALSPIVDIFPFGEETIDRATFGNQISEEVKNVWSDLEGLQKSLQKQGFTIYDTLSTEFPNDCEEVTVFYDNGVVGPCVFWDIEEGFDAMTEPHHLQVIAWKRITINIENATAKTN